MIQFKSELKIIGINPILIFSGLVAVYSVFAAIADNSLPISCIGSEVIFPFFASVAIGEWSRIKSDENFDLIAAQGKSLFSWLTCRFFTVFCTVSIFATLCISLVSYVRNDISFLEMVLLYVSPAFFLSTLAELLNLFFTHEHVSTLTCGVIWLITILIKSLLRFPGVEYIYLFIRYAGDRNGIWMINKALLLVISGIMWVGIYLYCQKK